MKKLFQLLFISIFIISCDKKTGAFKPQKGNQRKIFAVYVGFDSLRKMSDIFRLEVDTFVVDRSDTLRPKSRMSREVYYFAPRMKILLDSAGNKVKTREGKDSLVLNWDQIPNRNIILAFDCVDLDLADSLVRKKDTVLKKVP